MAAFFYTKRLAYINTEIIRTQLKTNVAKKYILWQIFSPSMPSTQVTDISMTNYLLKILHEFYICFIQRKNHEFYYRLCFFTSVNHKLLIKSCPSTLFFVEHILWKTDIHVQDIHYAKCVYLLAFLSEIVSM